MSDARTSEHCILGSTFSHLRDLPNGSLSRAEVGILLDAVSAQAERVASLEAENATLRAAINDAIPRMRQAVDQGDPDSLFFVEDDLRSALRDDAGGGGVTDRTSNEDRSET